MPKAGELIHAYDVIRVAGVQEASDASAVSTTETVVSTISFPAIIGNIYELRFNMKLLQSVASDHFLFTLREDNLAGTLIDQWILPVAPAASNGYMVIYQLDWTAASTTTKTIVGTLVRSSGTGTCTRLAKANYQIYRES